MLDKNEALYCGIDTHKKFHQAVVTNRFEEEVAGFEIGNTREEIENFSEELKKLAKPVAVGIEGSYSMGYLLSEILVRDAFLQHRLEQI